MTASGDHRRDQRDRAEGEQEQQQDLGEDHPDRERPEQAEGTELADEEDDRQQQPLVLAALLHRVGGGLVGDAEAVAGPLGVGEVGGVAVVQRVVLAVPFVLLGGAEAVAQEARRVLVRVVDADLVAGRDLGPGLEAARERGVAGRIGGERPDGDRDGIRVLVAGPGADAVFKAAEVEDDPGLEHEEVEQLLPRVLPRLPRARRAAAGRDRQERP